MARQENITREEFLQGLRKAMDEAQLDPPEDLEAMAELIPLVNEHDPELGRLIETLITHLREDLQAVEAQVKLRLEIG